MEPIHMHTIVTASVMEGSPTSAKVTLCEGHLIHGFCDCAKAETPGSIKIAAHISQWLKALPTAIIDVAILLLLLSSPLLAQESPRLPKFTRTDFGIFSYDVAMRGLDVYSTTRALRNPDNHERFLPHAIAYHPAALTAYSAGCVFSDWLIYRHLRVRHPKLARWIPAIDATQDGYWALQNLTLPEHPRRSGALHRR